VTGFRCSDTVRGPDQRVPNTLSRWRHGFEPRWDYQVRDYVGALSPSPGNTPGDSSPAEEAIHPHRGVALKLVDDFLAFAACSAMVRTACSRMSRSPRAIARCLPEGSVDRWGKPRNGLPRRGSLGPDSAEEVQPRSYGSWSPNGISGLTDPRSI
jgi:hypothetical protein